MALKIKAPQIQYFINIVAIEMVNLRGLPIFRHVRGSAMVHAHGMVIPPSVVIPDIGQINPNESLWLPSGNLT